MERADTDYSRLAEVARRLGLHEHLCLIYDSQEQQFAAALPYLRAGLERGEKCLYIVDENTAAAVLDALRKGGIDVDHYRRSGALTTADSHVTYLKEGRFDPDGMIAFLTQAIAEARATRFSGLRTLLGEMTWVLGKSDGIDRLIEYESKLNLFIRDHDARVICQYNRARFSPELILGVLRTHPLVVYGGLVCKNPYYIPPDEFQSPNQASQEVERFLHNILTWERAEEALRHSEERVRLIIDTIPTMAWSVRPDGAVDFVNQRWLDYTGLSLEEAIEQPTRAIHPEDLPRVMEKWRVHLAAGEPFEDEMRLQRANGEYRWFLVRTTPLRDKHGNIVKWYGSSVDIEDRKRAEMESRYLIDAIPQQIWSGPPDGTIDYCNDRWRSETGLALEDLRGDGWQTVLYPKDRDRVLKAWHKSVQNGTPYEQEERHWEADGTYRWYLSRGVPLRDAEGRIVRWYGTNTDIEDRKQAEEGLRRLSGQLLKSQDEERRRIARELHDSTGQKLTALLLTLSSLKGPVTELDFKSRRAFRECLALAKQSAREMRSLTYLLHPPMLEQFGLADTLRWFVREFGRRSGIAVRLKVPSQIERLPKDMTTTLFRIVQEALSNVQQHSGSKKAQVTLVLNNNQVVLEVKDFGHGIVIPPDSKRRRGKPMLGVGIAGVRERVEQFGGELQVNFSEKGTVLRAVLPIERRAA